MPRHRLIVSAGDEANPETIKAKGIADASKMDGLKVLAFGTLTKKLKVSAHKFSSAAKAAIEANGGEAISLGESAQ